MKPSDSDHSLRPVSFIVLGMLATAGPMTSYELEHNARVSVGFFWPFPHSQLYAEPRKLVEAGLVDVESEEGGRRRRVCPLARRKVAELESRLEFLERDDLGGDRPHHRMVLAWGRAQTRSNLEFWRSIAEEAE